MTEEEIRRRAASPEAVAMVVRSLQRSRRLRERAPLWLQKLAQKKERLILAFGRILVQRCQASNRRGAQCAKTAIQNKSVCRNHGGKSTGARTEEGKRRSREANLHHGERSVQGTLRAREDGVRVRQLADAVRVLGLGANVKRARGKWPEGYKPIEDEAGVLDLVQKLRIRREG
jgi:hypothetical protein